MTEMAVERMISSALFPLSSPRFVPLSMGRYALIAALRLIGRARQGRLLLPAYICRSVTDALDRHGYAYSFYPVTRATLPEFDEIRSLLVGKVSSLLFVNYFGFPHPVDRLLELCRQRGIVLIEDNAHGFLGIDENGVPLGARGDVGIFSFPKTMYVPDGGGMVVNSPELADRLVSCSEPVTAPGIHGSFLVKRRILRTIESIGIDSRAVAGPGRGEDEVEETVRGGERRMSAVTKHLLENIDPVRAAEYRRRNYRAVAKIVGESGLKTLYPDPGGSVCPYLVPVVAGKTESRDRAGTVLRRMGWKVSHWPDLPPDLDKRKYAEAWWLRENIMAVYLRPALV